MKNSKIVLSEEGTNRHLPADLWPEILSRLPVKSLLRFHCVSKSWLSMITDPGFCRLHLENFKNNRDETQLLVLQAHGGQLNCVLRCSDTFETNAEVVHTLGRRYKQEGWNIEYTIDGLVLLRSYTRDLMDWVSSELMDWSCKLRLWNPSIRKFHDIPPLPETGEYDKSSLDEHIIGLGYDPLCKDYKYVELIFSYIRDEILCCSAIYTLGAHLWKITPCQFPGCFNRHSRVISPVEDTTVYFQGSLYFIVYHLTRSVLELVSVDLSSEVFTCTSLPDCGCYSESVSGPLTVVDDGCSLALFDGQCGTMWVLDSSSAETKPACWSRRYSFCFHILDFDAFKYHKKNGEILRLGEAKTPISMTLTDEQWDLLSSYNLETKRQKILFHSPRDFTVHNIYGYVESLIMLK